MLTIILDVPIRVTPAQVKQYKSGDMLCPANKSFRDFFDADQNITVGVGGWSCHAHLQDIGLILRGELDISRRKEIFELDQGTSQGIDTVYRLEGKICRNR